MNLTVITNQNTQVQKNFLYDKYFCQLKISKSLKHFFYLHNSLFNKINELAAQLMDKPVFKQVVKILINFWLH